MPRAWDELDLAVATVRRAHPKGQFDLSAPIEYQIPLPRPLGCTDPESIHQVGSDEDAISIANSRVQWLPEGKTGGRPRQIVPHNVAAQGYAARLLAARDSVRIE